MGWFGFGKAERSSGSTGKVEKVDLNVKTNKSGKATDVLVGKSGRNPHSNHTHYYSKGRTGWGSSKKGKG